MYDACLLLPLHHCYHNNATAIATAAAAAATAATTATTVLQNVITDARGTGLAQLMSRNPDPLGAFNGSLAYPHGAGCTSVFTL
jgi:hypothetical protein